VGNGSPGFRTASGALWPTALAPGTTGEAWRLARDTAVSFNGTEGRYDNEAIGAGGMDFSDTAESCYIFGYPALEDAAAFFEAFPGR
jgi:hypothetical protein